MHFLCADLVVGMCINSDHIVVFRRDRSSVSNILMPDGTGQYCVVMWVHYQ